MLYRLPWLLFRPAFSISHLPLCEKGSGGELFCQQLLYKSGFESRYTSFLKYNPDRNLILIRQKCLDFLGSTLEGLFGHGDRDHFDDVLWLNPEEILS